MQSYIGWDMIFLQMPFCITIVNYSFLIINYLILLPTPYSPLPSKVNPQLNITIFPPNGFWHKIGSWRG